ncbi:peptidoglycan-binding protein [Paenarthrobacter sp. NPDC057355]|uniref:peptidoglycan-binding domain-containing protein n=1 Tax=Paenarthrobacter sp. NPDC057355 TaxID=3346105 RepID=UPI0036332B7B
MSKMTRRSKLALTSVAASLALGALSVAAPAPAQAAGRCVDYNYSYGGYSSCVGNIQVLLNAFRTRIGSPYAPLAVDNSYGPATRNAVIGFQRFWGLQPDGVVGPRTWNILCSPQMGPGPISWYPYSAARASGCNI